MLLAAFVPFVLLALLGVLAVVVARRLPATMTDPIGEAIAAGGWIPLAVLGVLAGLVLPVAPLLLAMRRFKRTRLLLD